MLDAIVIGCGIIGAATAYELSQYRLSVAVLEAENDVSTGTTKANSAILHAGYDPKPGSMMAKLNVNGSRMAKELCRALDVPYKQVGSYVVAFSEGELAKLQELYDNGVQNGVEGVALIDGDELRLREPNIGKDAIKALYAPSAAIVSPWEYALALAETAVKNGVQLKLSHKVLNIDKIDGGWRVNTDKGAFEARVVLNAAGIHADIIHNMVAEPSFSISPSKGEYYLLDTSEGKTVNSVIFQAPSKDGKGVLVAPTVHGNLIVGPNAKASGEDLSTTAEGMEFVGKMAKKSVPSLNLRSSIRNFAGLRANTEHEDFIIEKAADGFIDIAGIKSPGLSAAPAIAKYAVSLMENEGVALRCKDDFVNTRRHICFKELPLEEKERLVAENPAYGRVICRCETVTEGEILACLNTPIPPVSVDGVKRRVRAGMGRCQGGFCGPRVLEILAREQKIPDVDVVQDKSGTYILTGKTKGEKRDV
ncbi:MAG: NAD(P)/FAD-dependent oxidoreductase [Oscillospiraceae bacterium]